MGFLRENGRDEDKRGPQASEVMENLLIRDKGEEIDNDFELMKRRRSKKQGPVSENQIFGGSGGQKLVSSGIDQEISFVNNNVFEDIEGRRKAQPCSTKAINFVLARNSQVCGQITPTSPGKALILHNKVVRDSPMLHNLLGFFQLALWWRIEGS
ncbi:hypothetical protein HAX54_019825 [Datura stramonium]|uniref:Uncharacterized protein n=1 Tax=Datura stramonium TaxID=4076 RepID=A0ABS8USC9_DATST|nr:hypothetical protein [Datura stramonium]